MANGPTAGNANDAADNVERSITKVEQNVGGATAEVNAQLQYFIGDQRGTTAANNTSAVVSTLERRGVGLDRLFNDPPNQEGWRSWIPFAADRNTGYNFERLNAPPGSNVVGDASSTQLTRAELQKVISEQGRPALDKIRAQYLLNNFDTIKALNPSGSPNQPRDRNSQYITDGAIRDHVRNRAGERAGRVTTATGPNVNREADTIGRYFSGDRNPQAVETLRKQLAGNEYFGNSPTSRANLAALVEKLNTTKMDGGLVRDWLTADANATGGLTIPHLQNLAAGKDVNGRPVTDRSLDQQLRRLAANVALARFGEIDGGLTGVRTPQVGAIGLNSSLSAAEINNWSIRRDGERAPLSTAWGVVTGNRSIISPWNSTSDVTSGAVTDRPPAASTSTLGVSTPAERQIRTPDGRTIVAPPDQVFSYDRNNPMVNAGNVVRAYLDAPEPRDPALLAGANIGSLLGNETATRQLFSDLNRTGHLGRFISDQLAETSNYNNSWPIVKQLGQIKESIIGGLTSDKAQVWGIGFSRQNLADLANNTGKPEAMRLAAKAALYQFDAIENSDGRDSNWGIWSNTNRLQHSEINQYRDNRSTASITTGDSVYPRTQAAASTFSQLAESVNSRNPQMIGSAERTLNGMGDLVNPGTNPEAQAQGEQLLQSLPTATVAKVGENYFDRLADTNQRLTRTSLDAAVNNTNLPVAARLAAKAMLRDTQFTSIMGSAANSYGIDRNALASLAIRPPEGYNTLRTGVISGDMRNMDRQSLASAIVDLSNPDQTSADALATLIRRDGRWTNNGTKGEADIEYQRNGQWYIGRANMQAYPGSRHVFSMSLTEQRAQMGPDGQVQRDANGRPVAADRGTMSMLANVRYDTNLAASDPNNVGRVERQKHQRTGQELPYRTPRWENNVSGYTVPDQTLTNGSIIPGQVISGPDARVGDALNTDGTQENRILALASMISSNQLRNNQTLNLDGGGTATVNFTEYPGRNGLKNYEIRVTDSNNNVLLRGIVDGGTTVRTVSQPRAWRVRSF